MAAGLCYGPRGGGLQLAPRYQVGVHDTGTLIGALEGGAASSVDRRRRCCGMGACPPQPGDGCMA
jgi:hypothetical protein